MKHLKLLAGSKVSLKDLRAPVLEKYLDENISYLEFKLRYCSMEETKLYQGSLRALDDIRDQLNLK